MVDATRVLFYAQITKREVFMKKNLVEWNPKTGDTFIDDDGDQLVIGYVDEHGCSSTLYLSDGNRIDRHYRNWEWYDDWCFEPAVFTTQVSESAEVVNKEPDNNAIFKWEQIGDTPQGTLILWPGKDQEMRLTVDNFKTANKLGSAISKASKEAFRNGRKSILNEIKRIEA